MPVPSCFVILIEKKLSERKYYDKLQKIVDEAKIDVLTNLKPNAKTNPKV